MNAVERAIAIVDYLASARSPSGVTQIGKDLGLGKSNVYRTLSALERRQWVVQDHDTAKYALGSRVLELGLLLLSHLDLRGVSLPYLHQLRDLTNETSIISMRVGLERMFVDQVQGGHEVRLVADLGKRVPLWCGASGKAVLAHLEPDEVEAVLDEVRSRGVQVLASGQPVDIVKLRGELSKIRRQGFAVSVGERLLGATGVSAPVFQHGHTVVGAISVGGIVPRFTTERAQALGAVLVQVASAISRQLGDSGGNGQH